MKFNIKFLKKKQHSFYIRKYFSVPSMGLIRAEILYHPEEVNNDNDIIYLIMKQIKANYNIQLLPDQIQLLN
jgi:hypothetical protein